MGITAGGPQRRRRDVLVSVWLVLVAIVTGSLLEIELNTLSRRHDRSGGWGNLLRHFERTGAIQETVRRRCLAVVCFSRTAVLVCVEVQVVLSGKIIV